MSYIEFYLILAVVLFSIGTLGMLLKKNSLVMLMCLELMLSAVSLTLVAFSRMHGNVDGQIFVMFIMGVAAAEIALGLAIVINLFRNFYSTEADVANVLKG